VTPKEHTHHRNTFLGALSESLRFSGFAQFAVPALKEPNKNERKCTQGYNSIHLPSPPLTRWPP